MNQHDQHDNDVMIDLQRQILTGDHMMWTLWLQIISETGYQQCHANELGGNTIQQSVGVQTTLVGITVSRMEYQ